jgi:hypothetical protein
MGSSRSARNCGRSGPLTCHWEAVATRSADERGSAEDLNRSGNQPYYHAAIWTHVGGVVDPALDEPTRLSARFAYRAPCSIAVQRHERRSLGDAPIAGARLIHPGSDRLGQYLFVRHCDSLQGDPKPQRCRQTGPKVPMTVFVWGTCGDDCRHGQSRLGLRLWMLNSYDWRSRLITASAASNTRPRSRSSCSSPLLEPFFQRSGTRAGVRPEHPPVWSARRGRHLARHLPSRAPRRDRREWPDRAGPSVRRFALSTLRVMNWFGRRGRICSRDRAPSWSMTLWTPPGSTSSPTCVTDLPVVSAPASRNRSKRGWLAMSCQLRGGNQAA